MLGMLPLAQAKLVQDDQTTRIGEDLSRIGWGYKKQAPRSSRGACSAHSRCVYHTFCLRPLAMCLIA